MDFSEAFSPVRAIQHGFEGLKRQPVGVLLGGFFMVLTSGGGGGNGGNSIPQDADPDVQAIMAAVTLAVVGIAACLGIVFWIFRSWLHPGWIRLHRDLVLDGHAEVSALFSGADAFVSMLLWKLLKGVIGMGAALAALVPGGVLLGLSFLGDEPNTPLAVAGGVLCLIFLVPTALYVGLGLSLGEFAVALEGAGPTEALSRSWELAAGNRLTLLVFYAVTGFFGMLGILACCVGVFVTRPIADVGTTEAYLLATREGLVSKLGEPAVA